MTQRVVDLREEAREARREAKRAFYGATSAIDDVQTILYNTLNGKKAGNLEKALESFTKATEKVKETASVAEEANTKHKKALFTAICAIEQALAEHPEGLTADQISDATNGLLSPESIVMAGHHEQERRKRPYDYTDEFGSCYGVRLAEEKKHTRRFCTVELDEDGDIIPGSRVITEKTDVIKLYKAIDLTDTVKEFLGI